MALYLRENLTFETAQIQLVEGKDGKDLYMEGICIQGGVKNANERVYPVSEIAEAVKTLNEQIKEGNSVLGEVVGIVLKVPSPNTKSIWSLFLVVT